MFWKMSRNKQKETGLSEEVGTKVQGKWKNRQFNVAATGISRLQREGDVDLL